MGEGSFNFEAQTYNQKGEYRYEVKETEKDYAGYSFDSHTYQIVVTVTDAGNGTMSKEVTVDGKTVTEKELSALAFTNYYKTGSLKVEKKVEGTSDTSKSFTFEVQLSPVVSGTYGDMKFDENGVATVTLKAGESKTATGLPEGTQYTVSETSIPDGYSLDASKTSGKSGNISSTSPATASFINLYEAKGTITFGGTKTLKNRNLEKGKFTFVLTKPDKTTEEVTNNADGSFSFSTIEYTLADLDQKDGKYVDTIKTYKITEKAGDDKAIVYDSSEYEVSVTLHDDGNGNIEVTYDKAPDKATFTNTATLVKVSKVDATNSKELAGATIQILDESGKVVAEWVSTTQAHEVVGLEAGKTYRLHETVAPDGYDLAEQDTTFSINKDGTVNAGTTKSVNGVLLVEDQAKKNALAFDKVSMFGMSMVGAKMAVIRLDAGGESVKDTWTTNGKAHQVEGISDGSYVFRELAAPNGFTLAPDVAFAVRDGKASLKQAGNGRLSTAGAVQVVVMTDAAQLGVRDQRFAKVDEQGKFLPGATLQIKTEEGNVIAEWTTDGSEHTERLIGGTYILTETEAPSGYQVADPISFIVNEKGFIISIGGKAVSGSTDVVVTMTDKKIAAVTKPENEKKQEGKGVKTGDDTPILPMTMTLAISALAVLLILNKRKKETGEQ